MVGLSTIHGVTLAIDLQDVTKTYRGGVQALRGVSLRVQSGEIFGLLGPNGAGKSTLVKIIMTVVRPTTLTGTVLGRPACTQEVLSQVGYLPEHHRFPQYLTGRQVVDFFGALAKVQRTERKARTEALLEMVGMRDWGNRRVTTYSKGMQQRIGIAAALINDPRLVVLDEPTDGVDPVGRREIRDMLLRIRAEGRTVLVNSHLLSEVEMLADRVAIINQGRMLAVDTPDRLQQAAEESNVVWVEAAGDEAAIKQALQAVDGVVSVTSSTVPNAKLLSFDCMVSEDEGIQQRIARAVTSAGELQRLERRKPTLENVFLRYVAQSSKNPEQVK